MILQIVIALLFISSCFIDARARERLSSQQALEQVGNHVEIAMVIGHSQDRRTEEGVIYLNDEHTRELLLTLTASAIAELKEQGIIDPAAYFLSKKLTVTGSIMRVGERYLLPIQTAEQLQLQK
ncbi:hypothetical protein [Shewanella dokdonensis]|uniref:Lipoprotein n=1 Tax=Shewanella dokdonensis TaxID=712036 RepID=A0ABX8DGG1_9GAMM|nr:hypothetical protein [Shewanella dokdonensis]MCL1074018.1 hypothetical protein [Shewanella dokdonensis]QVK23775.1 hypothetical protein KHX94_03540 [Shewanella dokdonensis]